MTALDIGICVVSFAATLLAAFYLLQPLFAVSAGGDAEGAVRRDEEVLLESLEAVEYDYLAGKLSSAEHDELRAEILREEEEKGV